MRPAILFLLLALPISAASAAPLVKVGTVTFSGYDEFIFLGWNSACSVAIQYFSYPPLGTAMTGVPDKWAIGTLTILPGEITVEKNWADRGISANAWNPSKAVAHTEEILKTGGYSPSGRMEKIRDAPVGDRPGLRFLIHSTATLELGYQIQWPPPNYLLESIRYSSLGNCAFILFRDKRNLRDSYRYRLTRILNPDVRRKRARAHVTNALFLYTKDSDIFAAEEELRIASDMDPEYPLALYYHAVLLATHGRYEESLAKLRSAVLLKSQYRKKARKAVEFEDLRKDLRFIKIVGKSGFFP